MIERALIADLDALWARAQLPGGGIDEVLLTEFLPGIVQRYGLAYGEVAAQWFEALIDSAPVVASTPNADVVANSVRYVLRPYRQAAVSVAGGVVRDRLVASMVRHAKRAGRDTLDLSVKATRGVLYARRLSGPSNCDFCVVLASRGPVYGNPLAAGEVGNRFHDGCDCDIVPVRGRWMPDSGNPRGVSWVGESPGYDFEKLYLEEYKPFWWPGATMDDVVAKRGKARVAATPKGKPGRPKGSKNRPTLAGAGGASKPPRIPSVEGMDVPDWLTDSVLDKIMNGVIWVNRRGKAALQGGHKHGKGWLGKTEFPESWTVDDVRKAIILTWNKPDAEKTAGDAVLRRKEIDGVVVHVHAWGENLKNINAAYPVCGKDVHLNTHTGRVKVPMMKNWRTEWF
ncbi:VG15 protein [Trueperella abortisuis]|uniref:VG15 protein n=1 Tax=Trueperella abortisuis TaxID=445930 RepID=UPI002892F8D8|nr:hypothetical protein [Trueperella abortisuis]